MWPDSLIKVIYDLFGIRRYRSQHAAMRRSHRRGAQLAVLAVTVGRQGTAGCADIGAQRLYEIIVAEARAGRWDRWHRLPGETPKQGHKPGQQGTAIMSLYMKAITSILTELKIKEGQEDVNQPA